VLARSCSICGGSKRTREWVEAYCDLVLKWRPSFWAEEKTQITSGIGPFIERRSIERRA
jgi:hypothetical protein